MKCFSILMLLMSAISCHQGQINPDLSIVVLHKLHIPEQFDSSLGYLYPDSLVGKGLTRQNEALKIYQDTYFNPSLIRKIASIFESHFTASEISKFQDMDSETIVSRNSVKYKAFEDELEELYDRIYLAGNQLRSGIRVIGNPNQAKPFEFFEVERADGLYPIDAFDSMMPQNAQIMNTPILPRTKIDKIRIIDHGNQFYSVELTMNSFAVQAIKNWTETEDGHVGLVLGKRIIGITDYDLNWEENKLLIYSPWEERELEDFIKNATYIHK